jgi:hypothetical protein
MASFRNNRNPVTVISHPHNTPYHVSSFSVFDKAASENTLLYRNYLHIFIITLPVTIAFIQLYENKNYSKKTKLRIFNTKECNKLLDKI